MSGKNSRMPAQIADGPFDFLEVYAGTGNMTAAWAKQGFRVLPPLSIQGSWDLRDGNLFWSILSLIRGGRIRFLWWPPPCTTFSLAQAPRLRSLENPWGFNLLDQDTCKGNLDAAQSLLLALGQAEAGNGFAGEQPAYGYMRALEPWETLRRRGAFEVLLDWCRFGARFKKTTQLLVNVATLQKLGLRCHHRSRHPPLKGALTIKAGEHCPKFCREVVKLVQTVWSEDCGLRGVVTTDVSSASDTVGVEKVCLPRGWAESCVTRQGRLERIRKGRQVLRCGLCSCPSLCPGTLLCNTSSRVSSTSISKKLRPVGP